MFKEIDLWENEPIIIKPAQTIDAFTEALDSVSWEDNFELTTKTTSAKELIEEEIRSYGATTYAEALRDYRACYGEIEHWKVDPSKAAYGDKAFFKFTLHCYNKYKSSIPKEKNIPAHWAKYFTSKSAKEMKPFGDFGVYHEIEDITVEDIYADQIQMLFETRTDCVKPSSLYNEALKVLEARAEEVVGHSLLDNNDYRWALCAIIANGALGIYNEILTVQGLKEEYENKETLVLRAPGEYENSGIDALFMDRKTGDIQTISIKTGNAFNMRTFQTFQYTYGKNTVDAYAGFRKAGDKVELVWAKEVPKP